MILERIRLISILDTLKIAVGNKVMGVSYYVKFMVDAEGGSVFLASTDFQTFLIVDYGDVAMNVLSDVPPEFLIKFKELYDLVKASTTQDVAISRKNPDKDDHIRVTTNGDFDFPTYTKPEQFPSADFDHKVAGSWESDVLKGIWDKVIVAASKDVTKRSYQGVNFDGNWAASDVRRFAIVKSESSYDGDPMLIPPQLGDVIARCKGDVTIGINGGGNMLIISSPENGIMGGMRLFDVPFVSYEKLFQDRSDVIKIILPKSDFLGTLRRLSCFSEQIYRIGTFTINRTDDGAEIRCTLNQEAGQADETIEAIDFEFQDGVMTGKIAEFQYQIDNLADGIGATKSDEDVSLCFQQDGKLWIDEDDFHYLLSRINA